jgi:hypothetical protein
MNLEFRAIIHFKSLNSVFYGDMEALKFRAVYV